MSRSPDPGKKPALLEQVIDHFLDKPLSTLTFRGLANALDISTFTLVYHFGTRTELIRDIIEAISSRQRGFETAIDPETVTIDSYIGGLRQTFDLTLLPRNRALQRLEFEAQLLEALEADQGATRTAHQFLQDRARDALSALGLSEEDAKVESRLLIDTFYGIQVGIVVTRDTAQATTAFERAIQNHRERITSLTTRTVTPL